MPPAPSEAVSTAASAAPPHPGFAEALRFWAWLGCVSFGGPAGQIAIMHRELVQKRRWISEGRYLHALNYCMILPGPEAQQLSIYTGWLLHGLRGGLAAGLLFILPSLVLLIVLSWLYLRFGQTVTASAILWGVKPAVVAIVLAAAWRIGSRTLHNGVLWSLAAAAFFALFALQAPFPLVIMAAGLVGWLGGRLAPEKFSTRAKHGGGGDEAALGAAVIDDQSPPLPHHRLPPRRIAALLLAGIGLGAAVFGSLILWQGLDDGLAKMAAFFTKAALLTFGGAYAVLPYVQQGAVEQYQWLSAAQMMDGLALGETTPGPLIMVVTYIGFLGGWQQELCGPGLLLWGGLAGALTATVFTFLPSFLFILGGAPLVEATHGQLKFTAPLTAITAAVVGVIFNLALFFASHVFCPAGLTASPDWLAIILGLGCALALIRFQIGTVKLICICVCLGLLKSLFT